MNCHLLLHYRSTHPWAFECSQSWLQYCRNQLWIRMTLPTIGRYQITHSYRNRWSALHIIKPWNIPIWITCSSVRISQKPGDRSAVLRVLSDAYTSADKGLVTLLGFVDLSAVLDTVDNHKFILIERIHHTFGISDCALRWITSYLDERNQFVRLGGTVSATTMVMAVVPATISIGPIGPCFVHLLHLWNYQNHRWCWIQRTILRTQMTLRFMATFPLRRLRG